MTKIPTIERSRCHGNGFTPPDTQHRTSPVETIQLPKGFFCIAAFHEGYEATQTSGLRPAIVHVGRRASVGGVPSWPHNFDLDIQCEVMRFIFLNKRRTEPTGPMRAKNIPKLCSVTLGGRFATKTFEVCKIDRYRDELNLQRKSRTSGSPRSLLPLCPSYAAIEVTDRP